MDVAFTESKVIGQAGKVEGSVPEQLLRGQALEKEVLNERGLIKNGKDSGGQIKYGNSIPYSVTGGGYRK